MSLHAYTPLLHAVKTSQPRSVMLKSRYKYNVFRLTLPMEYGKFNLI